MFEDLYIINNVRVFVFTKTVHSLMGLNPFENSHEE